MIDNATLDYAARRAVQLCGERGITLDEATQAVALALANVESGLGVEPTSNLFAAEQKLDTSPSSAIKAIGQSVSPWLWVVSLISFGMALLNTHRVTRLYKKWNIKE